MTIAKKRRRGRPACKNTVTTSNTRVVSPMEGDDEWPMQILPVSNVATAPRLGAPNHAATAAAKSEVWGCQICLEGDNPEEILLCDKCDLEYHMACLTPPLSAVPDGNWFCYDCREYGDDLDEQVAKLPPEFTSHFGTVVWARRRPDHAWWPTLVYDPRYTEGATRTMARRFLGNRHVCYFFRSEGDSFAFPDPRHVQPWGEGMQSRPNHTANGNEPAEFKRAIQLAYKAQKNLRKRQERVPRTSAGDEKHATSQPSPRPTASPTSPHAAPQQLGRTGVIFRTKAKGPSLLLQARATAPNLEAPAAVRPARSMDQLRTQALGETPWQLEGHVPNSSDIAQSSHSSSSNFRMSLKISKPSSHQPAKPSNHSPFVDITEQPDPLSGSEVSQHPPYRHPPNSKATEQPSGPSRPGEIEVAFDDDGEHTFPRDLCLGGRKDKLCGSSDSSSSTHEGISTYEVPAWDDVASHQRREGSPSPPEEIETALNDDEKRTFRLDPHIGGHSRNQFLDSSDSETSERATAVGNASHTPGPAVVCRIYVTRVPGHDGTYRGFRFVHPDVTFAELRGAIDQEEEDEEEDDEEDEADEAGRLPATWRFVTTYGPLSRSVEDHSAVASYCPHAPDGLFGDIKSFRVTLINEGDF